MNVRHSNRPRKTPTKYAEDADNSVDESPRTLSLASTWNEQSLKQFYNAVLKHGGNNWKKVSAACSRPPATCQRLYEKHQLFLNTISAEHAAVMMQYFLSAARDAMASELLDGISSENPPSSTGRRASGSDFPTPTKARRTPRQRALAEAVLSEEGVERSPSVHPSRSRRLDFDAAAAKDSSAAGHGGPLEFQGLSGLDVLAAAAATDALGAAADAGPASTRGGAKRRWGQALEPWANGGGGDWDGGAPAANGAAAEGGDSGGSPWREAATPRNGATPSKRRGAKLTPVKEDDGGRLEGAKSAVSLRIDVDHAGGDRDSEDGESASREQSQNGAHPAEAGAVSSTHFRRRARKRPAERLPLSLMQYKAWLMADGGATGDAPGGARAPPDDGSQPLRDAEARLRHCLGLRARRWCLYEFFCSAIDRPFWLTGGMSDALHEMGLGKVNKLTRREWSMLRSALGQPRRLSEAFLFQERCALHGHRERARAEYDKRRLSDGHPLPLDVPTQCHVGQAVVARHPVMRSMHDGSVLTVGVDDSHTYIVQFHRSDLGVCKVQDVDVMPENPFLNLPTMMKADLPVDVLFGRAAPADLLSMPPEPSHFSAAAIAGAVGRHVPLHLPAQDVEESDLRVMDEVSALLDRKSALLQDLRDLNQRASNGEGCDAAGHFSEEFQHVYASKVILIKETSHSLDTACAALKRRVDDLMDFNTIVTRTDADTATNPLSSEDTVKAVARKIVDESMAEAAALVNALVSSQRLEIGRGPTAAGAESGGPTEAVSLYKLDDEMLMLMSIKLTAMFIAIQRCAASNQDERTVQAALLQLVSSIKPASHANSAHFQNITRHMTRLATYLGGR